MFRLIQTNVERVGDNGVLLQADASQPHEMLDALAGQAQCVYIDPPFMTGDSFKRRRSFGESGWRTGRQSVVLPAYEDKFDTREEYLAFLRALIQRAKALLAPTGVFCLHLDWRNAAWGRILCDEIFGEKMFLNEIVWAYESGGRATKRFSRKHDTILLYSRGRKYTFDISKVALTRSGARKNHMRRQVDEKGSSYSSIRSGGKEYRYYDDAPVYPGDVWTDISHLQQRDPERTGYATQKPLKLLERLLKPVVNPGDLVIDLCCGSGTTLVAANRLGCRYVGVDQHADALHVASARLKMSYALQAPSNMGKAQLDATFDPATGVVTLLGFDAQDATYPKDEDRLAAVEQWRAGRVVDGEMVSAQAFWRSRKHPDLPVWTLIPEGEGVPAVSVTDASGRRYVYIWEE